MLSAVILNRRGVGPGLVIRSRHLLAFSTPATSYRLQRTFAQEQQDPFVLAFAKLSQASAAPRTSVSALNGITLPPNVQLTTLQMLDDETVLLRLSHLYAVDEDAEMSEVVSVDVANALPMLNIDSMVELTLSANQVNEETVDIFLQQLACSRSKGFHH